MGRCTSPRNRAVRLSVPLAMALGACTGAIDAREEGSDRGPTGQPRTPRDGTRPTDPKPGASNATPGACTGPTTGPAPLVRLTNTEYRNTIRDLFPRVSLSGMQLELPGEVATKGFLATAETQTPSAELIEDVRENARLVARAATADLTKVLPCKPTSAADEPACARQFLEAFGKQAFRRPLTAAERDRYGQVIADAHPRWGLGTTVRLLIEAVLQSPNFLYRIEKPAMGPGPVALDRYEMATRLAYFLTDSGPDATLMAAAEAGKLGTVAGVEAEARRLLGETRTRAAVASFSAQWLRFEGMDNLVKNPTLFPTFGPAMAASLKEATVKYVDRLFWDEGRTLEVLLTDDRAFVDGQLAPLYGVPAPATMSLVRVDGTRRSGILTQAGLMAAFAHERTSAPVLRGVFVLERFLCAAPPPPPPGIETMLPELGPEAQLTTRQQLERSHSSPTCAACHEAIDGAGFGFEHYDALGQWRTEEFGLPVNARGEIVGGDVAGPFDGAVELGRKLAGSQQVRACVAGHVLAYALGVTREQLDDCTIDPVVKAFAAAKGDMRELLVAVVKSDAFRMRAATP